jgi:hypothetical protein
VSKNYPIITFTLGVSFFTKMFILAGQDKFFDMPRLLSVVLTLWKSVWWHAKSFLKNNIYILVNINDILFITLSLYNNELYYNLTSIKNFCYILATFITTQLVLVFSLYEYIQAVTSSSLAIVAWKVCDPASAVRAMCLNIFGSESTETSGTSGTSGGDTEASEAVNGASGGEDDILNVLGGETEQTGAGAVKGASGGGDEDLNVLGGGGKTEAVKGASGGGDEGGVGGAASMYMTEVSSMVVRELMI